MVNLPKDFTDYTLHLMGEERYSAYIKGMECEPPVSIRINPFKTKCTSCKNPVTWCEGGYYLDKRPNFTFDPLLHAGLYYVQEASSMFLDRIIRQYISHPVTMLDMCAAPGGKSTVARAALPEGSILFCNEPIRTRANILAENIEKFGHSQVIVTNNYPRDYRKSGMTFDVILCDVPCSGEGMFRKDEDAIKEWSIANVEKCRILQREIIEDAWECLKPNGILIYSTCTFNTREDEENIKWIQDQYGATVLNVNCSDKEKIISSLLADYNESVYRFIPGITKGEGIFMAILRKNASVNKVYQRKDKLKGKNKNTRTPLPKQINSWLNNINDYTVNRVNETIIAIPNHMLSLYETAEKKLKILSAGIKLAIIKGKDIIPTQSLALSQDLCTEAFNTIDVDYHTAISYLRKETLHLSENTDKGYILITFRGKPLGFMKNIGSRANNLYPQEWKIKSSFTPEQYTSII